MMMSSSKTCSTYHVSLCLIFFSAFLFLFVFILVVRELGADNLLSCSGDDEPTAQPIPAQPVQVPRVEPQLDLPQSDVRQTALENAPVERATDPRKQPSGPAAAAKDDDDDVDKALIHDGGAQESNSRDEIFLKDTRPNPNKHEDG
jgi:hypothetical protein